VSSLPKAVTWKRTGRDSNPRPFGSRANALPLRHTGHIAQVVHEISYGNNICLDEQTTERGGLTARIHNASSDAVWCRRHNNAQILCHYIAILHLQCTGGHLSNLFGNLLALFLSFVTGLLVGFHFLQRRCSLKLELCW